MEHPDRRKSLSTIQLLKQLVAEEGFATLYRGLVPVLQSLCISNFVYFYTFHSLKALHSTDRGGQNALKDLFLGALSGVINVLSTTPFWVVNTRLKMKGLQGGSSNFPYSNLLEGLLHIARTEGIPGLWAGTVPSLVLVANPALQFMMYEVLKRRLAKWTQTPSAVTFFFIGAVAKAFATIATYPLQLIQTQIRHGRTEHSKKLPPNAGVIQMLVYIIKYNGVAGLFRGLEAKLLQTVLTAALMFTAYENIAKFVMSLLLRKQHTSSK